MDSQVIRIMVLLKKFTKLLYYVPLEVRLPILNIYVIDL